MFASCFLSHFFKFYIFYQESTLTFIFLHFLWNLCQEIAWCCTAVVKLLYSCCTSVVTRSVMLFKKIKAVNLQGVPRNLTVKRRLEDRLRSLKLVAAVIRRPIITIITLPDIYKTCSAFFVLSIIPSGFNILNKNKNCGNFIKSIKKADHILKYLVIINPKN